MGPEVTVLVPTYNSGAYLAEALESVFYQTYTNWKLIIVDDASTDDSLATIKEYTADSRVTVVRNHCNKGQSQSLNKGLALVDTPFTVQLDADDWYLPHTLEVLVRKAHTLPQRFAVISGNIEIIFEDSQGGVMGTAVWKNRSFHDPYDYLLANNSLWPRFYRTKALERIGGWPVDDPYEGRYMEDRILLRLIEHYDFYWVDQILYKHRRHGKNLTNEIAIYNKIIEWAVYDALKRWGDKYDPVFKCSGKNLKKVVKLIPKAPC